MLLRSSSTPVINSSERDGFFLDFTKPVSPTRISMSSTSTSFDESSVKKIMSAFSESDIKEMCMHGLLSVSSPVDEEKKQDFNQEVGVRRSRVLEVVEVDGGAGGGGTGGRGGGSGCRDGNGGGFEYWDSNNGYGNTDLYYRKMIEANPGNDLLLSNYAKFLKEVRGDYIKAEEYCKRALMVNSSDGNALSLYADLIWQMHRDNIRADIYYDQAVKTNPDNCYLLASYARFLWESEVEEKKEEESGEVN